MGAAVILNVRLPVECGAVARDGDAALRVRRELLMGARAPRFFVSFVRWVVEGQWRDRAQCPLARVRPFALLPHTAGAPGRPTGMPSRTPEFAESARRNVWVDDSLRGGTSERRL